MGVVPLLSRRLGADAAARLLRHTWPGNVRELVNAIKRALTLTRRPVLAASDFGFLGAAPATPAGAGTEDVDWLAGTLPDAVARLEAAMVRRALDTASSNRAQAAELLGIRRQLLYDKPDRYGIRGTTPEQVLSDQRSLASQHRFKPPDLKAPRQ